MIMQYKGGLKDLICPEKGVYFKAIKFK